MSVELSAGDAEIVLHATLPAGLGTPQTFGLMMDFMSKLKESLILPQGEKWRTLFALDQTSLLDSFLDETTGVQENTPDDTPTGATNEE
jgi:hypothetical protein